MAVPGPASCPASVRMGSSCPALQWRRNSPGRQQHRGNPCRHGHCCCPAELRHQGAGLAPSQQRAFPPTVAGGHFCGISFPVCLSRAANPRQGLRRVARVCVLNARHFLWTPNKAFPLWPQPSCIGHIVQNASQVTPLPLLCPVMAAWLFCIQFCISTFSVLKLPSGLPVTFLCTK